MPETTIPETITITLSAWEVTSLSAWLDVTEPDHCGGQPDDDEHDAEGHGLEGSDCMGYCPGDIADLQRVGDKMMQAARAAGW